MEYDWCPVKLGLTTPDDPEHAYMQCVDPGKPYTEGGTVIFKCRRITEKGNSMARQKDEQERNISKA